MVLLLLSLQNKVIFDRMRSTALDMATPGYDPSTGFGFIAGNTLLVSEYIRCKQVYTNRAVLCLIGLVIF
jgi:hypothetical protein